MRRYSIICKYGLFDPGPSTIYEEGSHRAKLQLVAGKMGLKHGMDDAVEQLNHIGLSPSESAFDLYAIAAAVYCADTRISREKESQDSWSREIDIYIPVSDVTAWNDLIPDLTSALEFLTGDKWRFFFRPRPRKFERIIPVKTDQRIYDPTAVCLFSGGLDSFIGVIDLLEKGHTPLLVSHSPTSTVIHYQEECYRVIQGKYGAKRAPRIKSRIFFKKNIIRNTKPENTERSRSFLFFSLAALAASDLKSPSTIYLPENGLISLNVPLDPLRLGSLSTRTTHPYFVARFNQILRKLNIGTQLENPYRHKSKGEMVRECLNQDFLAAKVKKTLSCASPRKWRYIHRSQDHCGHCVPCVIRQAALRSWSNGDPTEYAYPIRPGNSFSSNDAKGEHIRSFQLAIQRLGKSLARAKILIHKGGPLNDFPEEIPELARMYLASMQEVADLLEKVKTPSNA